MIKKFNLLKTLLFSPAQIWHSRISWRIALAVFLTILTVQVSILNFTIKNFEQNQLAQLREVSRSAIIPLMNKRVRSFLDSPFSREHIDRLIANTIVQGIAVYSTEFDLLERYGDSTTLILRGPEGLADTHRSTDGTSYETIFGLQDLGRPYAIIVRLDSEVVDQRVSTYIRDTILIMLLMSAFVTTVLMAALGRWLLEPILFLRHNLLAASKDPENPRIQESPFDSSDEIGNAIELANRLIEQNAQNLRQTKMAAEDKIHKLAYYDTLTKLPNRTLFLQKLSERIREGANDPNVRFAILAIDLDHFKDINDSMGHNVGDAILRGVSKRLSSIMPDSATVSRSGEDEFAITISLDNSSPSAKDIARQILNTIRGEPFKVFNEQFQISASIGLAVFPDDGLEPDQVLKNADIALNRAKEEGRDRIKQYSEDFDREVQQRFQILRDLRDALEQGQLDLHYQPQFDLKTGAIVGAEALLRWWKPDNSKDGGSFVSPGMFIPVAEQSGLMSPIGQWVMQHACETAARWHKDHGYSGRIAVNVSAIQFTQGNIVEHVKNVIKDTGIDPRLLELEVTESVFMENVHNTIDILKELHALGVELAIDDFGTGYSSLSYLRQFPIDRLKIDQSFIRNALNNPDDASIARTIVALGHALNLNVIAEGVETKEHEAFLIVEGCDEVQGFRYSKPVPSDTFIKFFTDYDNDLSVFDKAA